MKKTLLFTLAFTVLLTSCTRTTEITSTYTPAAFIEDSETQVPTQAPPPSATSTPNIPLQPSLESASYGPTSEDFPENINPLTGLPVTDPAQLREPAILLSVPHFPAVARPQAGISFSPWVFEFLIAQGTTRFLASFYGETPYQETPITGDCNVRMEPFVQTDLILGNFIWHDSNENGIQDVGERGIGGVCVRLLDDKGNILESSSSDSNGYYGFNVQAGDAVQIEVALPDGMSFTQKDVGYEEHDSDIDSSTGRSTVRRLSADERHLDVGLLLSESVLAKRDEVIPTFGEQVGPVRSGRLVYIPIHEFMQYSCLIYAGADPRVLDLLPRCALVYGENNGAGGFLDIERMKRISAQNAEGTHSDFNYASNLFAEEPPKDGVPAEELHIFTSLLNQSMWVYDPLHQGYLRYVDDVSETPTFHPEIDRLTGRELLFQNVILLEAEHDVWAPRIIEMHLEQGLAGDATLFRDGQKFDIQWSTRATEYEQTSGKRNPIQFQDKDGNPIALRPGQTWIFIITPYSQLEDEGNDLWRLRIYSPEGAGEY